MTGKRNYCGIFVVFIIAVSMMGCRGEKKSTGNDSGYTQYEQALTNKDTTAVMNLVESFMQYVEVGKCAEAASMLYQSDPDDKYGECNLLENDELQEVTTFLKQITIKKHRIDYIKFNEVYDNEVKCTAIIEEAHDGMPEISTVFYFKPVDYLGHWVLCLLNSRDGDRRTIQGHDND